MPMGSNLATPRGLIVSEKIFFSETSSPRASIFCMQQCLVVPIIKCANHAPGVKFGHAPGVNSLHRLDFTSEANLDTQSSDISAEEISESGRSFQSLIVCGKKLLLYAYLLAEGI